MSDQLIVHHCAPTLAGLKAGSLFSCPCRDAGQLTGELRRLNRALAPKGLRVLPLQTEKGRALIYLYRPRALERELAGGATARKPPAAALRGWPENCGRGRRSPTRSGCF